MERIVEQGLLYDFYGELLTEHQKKIYEDVVYHDMSLTEIAEENGISRQGVHDLIKRCDHILEGYENRLHLVERFLRIREQVKQMQTLVEDKKLDRDSLGQEIGALSRQILEEL